MHRALACFVVLPAVCAGHAAGQNVLDANPSVYGGTSNPQAPRPAASRDVYSVSSSTGTMVYNRANAFNDSTYSIYQRYGIDRFSNNPTAGVSRSGDLQAPPQAPDPNSPLAATSGTLVQSTDRSGGTTRVAQNAVYAQRPSYSPDSVVEATPSGFRPIDRPIETPSHPPTYSLIASGSERSNETSSGVRAYSVMRESDWPWIQ